MKQLDKVILLKKITNVDEAKAFIDELARCGKIFHFDDNPYEVEVLTPYEALHVDARVIEIFNLKNPNWGEHQDCYGYGLYKLNH